MKRKKRRKDWMPETDEVNPFVQIGRCFVPDTVQYAGATVEDSQSVHG